MTLLRKPFTELVNLTLSAVEVNREQVTFTTTDGRMFVQNHYQKCCENVVVDDICGDLNDLVGVPILMAEESSNSTTRSDGTAINERTDELWTFYRISTIKGTVVIRWCGTSNGYYSVNVDFSEVKQ